LVTNDDYFPIYVLETNQVLKKLTLG